ncbi:hypothetical protein FKM82_018349 [Ascaphus truei]
MWAGSGCAAAAGLLGALSACSAKLALGADYLREACEAAAGDQGGTCQWVHLLLRLCCVCLVFACNAVMWTFFAKALRFSSSSASATVTTTGSNFVSSVNTVRQTLYVGLCFGVYRCNALFHNGLVPSSINR